MKVHNFKYHLAFARTFIFLLILLSHSNSCVNSKSLSRDENVHKEIVGDEIVSVPIIQQEKITSKSSSGPTIVNRVLEQEGGIRRFDAEIGDSEKNNDAIIQGQVLEVINRPSAIEHEQNQQKSVSSSQKNDIADQSEHSSFDSILAGQEPTTPDVSQKIENIDQQKRANLTDTRIREKKNDEFRSERDSEMSLDGMWEPKVKEWKEQAILLQGQLKNQTFLELLKKKALDILPDFPTFSENQLLEGLRVISLKRNYSPYPLSDSLIYKMNITSLDEKEVKIIKYAESAIPGEDRETFSENIYQCINSLKIFYCMKIYVFPIIIDNLPKAFNQTSPLQPEEVSSFSFLLQKSDRKARNVRKAAEFYEQKFSSPETVILKILEDALNIKPASESQTYLDTNDETLMKLLTPGQMKILKMGEKFLPESAKKEYSRQMYSCVRRFEYFSCVKNFAWPMMKQYFPALVEFPDYQSWYPIPITETVFQGYPILPFPSSPNNNGQLPEVVEADAIRYQILRPETLIINILRKTLDHQSRQQVFTSVPFSENFRYITEEQLASIRMAEQLVPVNQRAEFVTKTIECIRDYSYLTCTRYSMWPMLRQWVPELPALPDWSSFFGSLSLPQLPQISSFFAGFPGFEIPDWTGYLPWVPSGNGSSIGSPIPVIIPAFPITNSTSPASPSSNSTTTSSSSSGTSNSTGSSNSTLTGSTSSGLSNSTSSETSNSTSTGSPSSGSSTTNSTSSTSSGPSNSTSSEPSNSTSSTSPSSGSSSNSESSNSSPSNSSSGIWSSSSTSSNSSFLLNSTSPINFPSSNTTTWNTTTTNPAQNVTEQIITIITTTTNSTLKNQFLKKPLMPATREAQIIKILYNIRLGIPNVPQFQSLESFYKGMMMPTCLNEQQLTILELSKGIVPPAARQELLSRSIGCLQGGTDFVSCTRNVIWPFLSFYTNNLPEFPDEQRNPPSKYTNAFRHPNLHIERVQPRSPLRSEVSADEEPIISVTGTHFVPIYSKQDEGIILNILSAISSLPQYSKIPPYQSRLPAFMEVLNGSLNGDQETIMKIAEYLFPDSNREGFFNGMLDCLGSEQNFILCTREIMWPQLKQSYKDLPSFPKFHEKVFIDNPLPSAEIYVKTGQQGDAMVTITDTRFMPIFSEPIEEVILRIFRMIQPNEPTIEKPEINSDNFSHKQTEILFRAQNLLPISLRNIFMKQVNDCTGNKGFVKCARDIIWPMISQFYPSLPSLPGFSDSELEPQKQTLLPPAAEQAVPLKVIVQNEPQPSAESEEARLKEILTQVTLQYEALKRRSPLLVPYKKLEDPTMTSLVTEEQSNIINQIEDLIPEKPRGQLTMRMLECIPENSFATCSRAFAWPIIRKLQADMKDVDIGAQISQFQLPEYGQSLTSNFPWLPPPPNQGILIPGYTPSVGEQSLKLI